MYQVNPLFQKSFYLAFLNGGSWRRWHSSHNLKLQPQRAHLIFLSNTAFSSSTEEIVEEECNDGVDPEAVQVVSRRRRPLRISSVTNRNIGEQRLYSSPGVEHRFEVMWNSNVKKFRAFVRQKFQRTKGQPTRRILPKDYPKDSSLNFWLRRVRTEYQRKLRGQPNRLTEQRIAQLRELGFQFIDTKHRGNWDFVFQQLCTYVKEHDGRHPHDMDYSTLCREGMKLFWWSKHQRFMYTVYMKQQNEDGYMNEKRVKALNSINFVWNVRKSQWDERYEELKQYRKAHGTTLVPTDYVGNYSLGRWVGTQRRQYALRQKNKPSFLTDGRIQLLNELEFVWDALEVRWMEHYHELVEYQRLNGQNEMPTNASNPSLRSWLMKQRKQYHKWINGEPSKMTARRKELLDQLGMDWTPDPKKKKSSGK